MKYSLHLAWKSGRCLALFAAALLAPALDAENVILFIGDGMGNEQVKAARCYNGGPLSFETLPYQAQVSTYSADNSVTDSAASGTAIATGTKVNNYVVSLATPGDGSELETTLEFYKKLGRKTGLITTTHLTHATPATFGAHESDRGNYPAIAGDYLQRSLPNILFGGGGQGLTPATTLAAGYDVAVDSSSFNSLNPGAVRLSAQFGTTFMPYEADYLTGTYPYPHLSEMVAKALAALGSHPDGFFLMVEGGMIDQACHSGLLEKSVHETLELSRAVQVALTWAAARTDTLILVTADHETGGLKVIQDNLAAAYPAVTWSTTAHTGVTVPAYAWGIDAERVTGLLDNTDMHRICTGKPMPTNLVPAGSSWSYDASGADLGAAWRETTFDDSSWPSGPAKLGYGDGNEVTLIPSSPVRSCYYFRHTFEADTPASYANLSLEVLRDDGAVVYLNGTEVARYNMPTGAIGYSTWAVTGADYSWDPAVSIPNLLVAGTNVLAVEIHQSSDTSSDIALDLNLKADRITGPPSAPVLAAVPNNGSVALTWTASADPEGGALTYLVYRRLAGGSYGVSPMVSGLTGLSYLDTSVVNDTTYGYLVRALDSAGDFADSAEVLATPFAPPPPDYNAYVSQNPTVTLGILAGSYTELAPGAAGAQTISELKTGTGARLDAEYLLQTIARPNEISAVTLHLAGSYVDTNDALVISLWTGSAWSDITAAMVNTSYTAPLGCVDANGVIRVRFTDSTNVRRETVGKLTLDELYATLTIGAPPPNGPPVAQNDTAETTMDTAATIHVLANDTDPEGEPLTVTAVAQPTHGAVTVNGDQTVTYVPAAGYIGTDSFTYTASDPRGGAAIATVDLNITPPSAFAVEVADISLTALLAGKSWKANATVTIVDQAGTAAAGATVVAEWLFNGTPILTGATAITDATGRALLTSPNVKTTGGTFTFRVTDVLLPGYTCTGVGNPVTVNVP